MSLDLVLGRTRRSFALGAADVGPVVEGLPQPFPLTAEQKEDLRVYLRHLPALPASEAADHARYAESLASRYGSLKARALAGDAGALADWRRLVLSVNELQTRALANDAGALLQLRAISRAAVFAPRFRVAGLPEYSRSPRIFQHTAYRLPTNADLDEIHACNLSSDQVLSGFIYTIVGKGITSKKNISAIITSLERLNQRHPDRRYQAALARAKELTPYKVEASGALPEGTTGYAPKKWIKTDEAEARVRKLMNPSGFFASKLSREQAEARVLADLRAEKTGIMSGMGLDLGALVVNRLRGRADDAPLWGPDRPLALDFSSAERRALRLLEPSTGQFAAEVVTWARGQGIAAKLSSQSVIYTPEDSARHYAEGRLGIGPGRLDWHNVGRAFHLVIVDRAGKADAAAHARVGAYVRNRGGEWLGDKVIRTPKGPVVDLAHYEYHPGIDIAAYRKSPLAQVEYRRAQARAKKFG